MSELASQPDRTDHQCMSFWLRKVACDVLQNGRRRIRDRHLEDALIRAYRVLELIGQSRLFAKGLDSACLDLNDSDVRYLQSKLEKKKSHGFGYGKGDCRTAGSKQVARLLKRKEDPVWKDLLDLAEGDKLATKRNISILIHGFEAKAPSKKSLETFYSKLESLLNSCDSAVAEFLNSGSIVMP